MPVARPESSDSRIIAHIDMDCFYVQVEQRKQPQLRGLPTAVVQYNEWKGGALIAVSYEARKLGVKRFMRGDEAKEVCPQIQLVQVPVARGKADLNAYRNAGSEVVSILARKGRCERASIDEVYLDLTDSAEAMLKEHPPESLEMIHDEALKSHVLGLKNENGIDAKENVREWLCRHDADHRDKLLACGALIVAELRMQVLKETEFTCSAGIAHNKMLAKLVSGMNKPAQQTVVPFSSVKELLDSLPIKKMKQLGGKLGTSLQFDLGVNTVGDLLQFSEAKLQDRYGINTGLWLWNIARGINGEEVQGRLLPKSHGSGKSFPGPRALKTIVSVQHWLNQLCEELSERLCSDLDQNKRMAHTLTLHANAYKSSDSDSHKKFPSKSCPLRYGTAKIQEDAFNLFQAGLREYLGSYGTKIQGSHQKGWGVTALSISASKIVAVPCGTCSITKYFQGQHPSHSSSKQMQNTFIQEATPVSSSSTENYLEPESTEPKIDFPYLEQQEKENIILTDKDLFCSSLKQTKDGFATETSQLLPSGSESCPGVNRSDSQGCFSRDDPRVILPSLEQPEQKANASKVKGTIFQFFKSGNPTYSSPKSENVDMVKDCRTNGDRHSSSQNLQREAWNYKIDEIDPSVIDELPPEIQNEIRVWLRPHKRPTVVKRGSTIAHYFSRTKAT
ncbi:DNA polymerase eta isoform X2 [Jatropha curcas]|uniref:DNA polymerase eta isoform X1 n=1 Tax=Jatropha curcas TaxID=180498 RepID=UPI00189547BF|nr:DNA polymerase eta isoform X1 [Jatropha curcas]XP_037496608.1 DNA polymerase eta isoform X2 [Jatropha curcas]